MQEHDTSTIDFCAGLVTSNFHDEITDPMVSAAVEVLRSLGGRVVEVVRVPGAYEFPLAVQCLFEDGVVDLVVVLGYIERGETLHGEIMGHVIQRSLIELELKHRKPIGIGIIGPGATAEQAEFRKLNYAVDACRAAFSMLRFLFERAPAGDEASRCQSLQQLSK